MANTFGVRIADWLFERFKGVQAGVYQGYIVIDVRYRGEIERFVDGEVLRSSRLPPPKTFEEVMERLREIQAEEARGGKG